MLYSLFCKKLPLVDEKHSWEGYKIYCIRTDKELNTKERKIKIKVPIKDMQQIRQKF